MFPLANKIKFLILIILINFGLLFYWQHSTLTTSNNSDENHRDWVSSVSISPRFDGKFFFIRTFPNFPQNLELPLEIEIIFQISSFPLILDKVNQIFSNFEINVKFFFRL